MISGAVGRLLHERSWRWVKNETRGRVGVLGYHRFHEARSFVCLWREQPGRFVYP